MQTSDNEGTPVSLIEAQAAGVPVVSTRVGGTASVVADPRFLAPVDDDAGLASAVRSLLSDPGLAREVGRRAQQTVLRRFTLDRLVAGIDRLYRAALD